MLTKRRNENVNPTLYMTTPENAHSDGVRVLYWVPSSTGCMQEGGGRLEGYPYKDGGTL